MTKRKNSGVAGSLAGILAAAALLASPATATADVRSADSFVDSIGVNVHMAFDNTPYRSQFGTIKERLAELGVRHVRDVLFPERTDQYQSLRDLADLGVKSTLVLGDPDSGVSVLESQLIPALESELAGDVDAVEGPNEYSTRGGTEWQSKLVAYQQRLHEDIKGNAALSTLPVIGPAIVHGDQEELGDVSSYLDYGNIHSYPEGNGPEYRMGSIVERAKFNSGTKPIIATETGYTNAIGWTPAGPGENRPIPEAETAIYMPRLFFEYFSRNISRTFSYELVDEQPDPNREDRESNFGLLRNDLSKKPAFTALSNTIHILEDPGPAFTPEALNYSLSGNTANLHRVVLQKRDGSFYLALWRIVSVWDPVAQTPLVPASEPVSLEVQPGIEAAEEYLPSSSNQPVWSVSGPSQPLNVDVGPEVVIVRVTLALEGPVSGGFAAPLPAPVPPPIARSNLHQRSRVRVSIDRRDANSLVLRGEVRPAPGVPRRIAIQRWSDRWRTISRVYTSADGSFRKRIELRGDGAGRFARIRVVKGNAEPSRTIRVLLHG